MAINSLPRISLDPEKLIPVIETDIFKDAPNSKFWIGVVAVNGHVANQEVLDATRKLRANVYIDEMHFLGEESRNDDGGETDGDDNRSVQFAIVENSEPQNGKQRVVATSRLIDKSLRSAPLPIEKIFPFCFKDSPTESNSAEASRLIARHEDKRIQHALGMSLIRSMQLDAYNRGVSSVYAIVEKPLYKFVSISGMPSTALAEVAPTPDFNNTLNIPIRINPEFFMETIFNDREKKQPFTRFFDRTLENLGLGYFDDTLA